MAVREDVVVLCIHPRRLELCASRGVRQVGAARAHRRGTAHPERLGSAPTPQRGPVFRSTPEEATNRAASRSPVVVVQRSDLGPRPPHDSPVLGDPHDDMAHDETEYGRKQEVRSGPPPERGSVAADEHHERPEWAEPRCGNGEPTRPPAFFHRRVIQLDATSVGCASVPTTERMSGVSRFARPAR